MAELPAGSLTVAVEANIGPLEKGLNQAKQKVAQADQQIGQAAQQAKGGFFEATGAVQGFQSQLSAALGVVAGFAAIGAIVGGLAQGFNEASEAVEGASDGIDALDKGTEAVLAKVPVFNQFAAAGRQLAPKNWLKQQHKQQESRRSSKGLRTAGPRLLRARLQSCASAARFSKPIQNKQRKPTGSLCFKHRLSVIKPLKQDEQACKALNN